MTATPPPPMPEPLGSLDIGRCFSDAAAVYRRNLVVLILAGFIFEVLSLLSLLILAGPLCGGACLMSIEALARPSRRVELGRLFGAFRWFWPLVGLFFLVVAAVLLGLLAFILPGLYLMTIWLFPFYLMVDKQTDIGQSLRLSYTVVMRQGFWPNFALALLVFALSLGPALVPYAGWVIGWFVTPFVWLVTASAYLQQTTGPGNPVGSLLTALDSPGPATCGKCGYAVRGLTSFACPECGADLREVGMIPSPRRGVRD